MPPYKYRIALLIQRPTQCMSSKVKAARDVRKRTLLDGRFYRDTPHPDKGHAVREDSPEEPSVP